jgi:hypothetical protein
MEAKGVWREERREFNEGEDSGWRGTRLAESRQSRWKGWVLIESVLREREI